MKFAIIVYSIVYLYFYWGIIMGIGAIGALERQISLLIALLFYFKID